MKRKDPFKTQLARSVFSGKYALTHDESWWERCLTVVDHVCGTAGGTQHPLMSKDDRMQLAEYIYELKFLPGGRYLYYAGRGAKFYNNCFSGDTRVLTDRGWKDLRLLQGETINILSPVTGKYTPAKVHNHGVQELNEIEFSPVRGKSKQKYFVYATPNHKWKLVDGSSTESLKVGDVVPATQVSLDKDDLGFAHGFVFGDGNKNGQLRLCADKDLKHLGRLAKVASSVSYPDFAEGNPCLYFNQNVDWKSLPSAEYNHPEYIASFIEGWIAADGSDDSLINSVSEENLLWFREYCSFAGIVVSGELRSQTRNITIGEYSYTDHKIYIQNFSRGNKWSGFKVTNIQPHSAEEVFCPYEPVFNQIIIDHGIHTFNCYLLKGEEDTREEWSAVTQRAMSCLMTGGGIGIDYSVFRPSGKILSRTGGEASGPIPLASAINEIGRNVKQGGSRRSAIYASLNWKHEDAPQFLRIKNWDEQQITGEYTVADAKAENFDYPATLDMTNISLNYDDAWLDKPDRATDETFLTNVEQALRTGEPGFSFNFREKENETLRNAYESVRPH